MKEPFRVMRCAVVLVAALCRFAAASTDFAFITTTDFVTGSSSSVGYCAPYPKTNDVQSIHSDAVARYYAGFIYVVNRQGGDNIQILDPNGGFSTVRQFSVGVNSDPHDIIVVDPTKAYVTRYNSTSLWIVDPSTGLQTGTIDLSALSDADGLPEMDQMARVGGHVFVTVQRIDRNNFPVGLSHVAVVDIAGDTLVDVDPGTAGVQSIALAGTNPFSSIQLDRYSGRLYVAGVGFFGLVDGGVEWVNPAAFQSEGLFYAEAAAGGDITDVEIVAPDKGYAIVIDANFNTVLRCFDPRTGADLGAVFSPAGFVLNDIELSPKRELWLADRTAVLPGIRIFDVTANSQITTNPIDVGLPPFDITFGLEVQTGIGDVPGAGTRLGQNYPNPFNPATTIPFSLQRSAWVRVRIYDVSGRRVVTLIDEARPPGSYEVTWNGRDAASRPASSGVYFVRLEAAGRVLTRKIVLLK